MHHALRPNCSGLIGWGRETYPFHTNDIALRDEKITSVAASVAEPRILLLGDSFVEGVQAWPDTVAGMVQASLPHLRLLNGGHTSYSPSNYLLLARRLIAAGIRFDEAVVFIDMSDIHDEAAYYSDNAETGGVDGTFTFEPVSTWYSRRRIDIASRYFLTDLALSYLEYLAIRAGIYFKPLHSFGNVFDLPRAAWTDRPVSDSSPFIAGYAPLGLERGIAKAQAKMTALREELGRRGIPLSVVVILAAPAGARSRRFASGCHLADWCAGGCKRFISLFPISSPSRTPAPGMRPAAGTTPSCSATSISTPRATRSSPTRSSRRLRQDLPNKLAP
jgi:hypothetical protein